MRMHTHGKCSPNIILGALTVFCVIVLYNYWTVSTINHDLALRIHSLEEQAISLTKANDALQANLDKVEEIKEKVEGNLKKEQLVDQMAKEEISKKEMKIKSLQNDLENSKQEGQNCRDDLTSLESKSQAKDKEISDLKAKVVSFEAQLVEKNNKVTRVEKELKETKKKLAEKVAAGVSSSTAKSASSAGQAPAVDIARPNEPPVLLSDPAVPYPKGWMEPQTFHQQPKIHVKVKAEGDSGIIRTRAMGPVIIYDSPTLPKAKARFSVVNRPKNEMNKPEPATGAAASPLKQPDSLHKPKVPENDGGEDFGQQPLGVLPVPGSHNNNNNGDQQQQQAHPAPNLDAAEDDGDRPLKDDFGLQDDQSPDGALSQKEMNGALQAPDMKHHNINNNNNNEILGQQQQPIPFDNNL